MTPQSKPQQTLDTAAEITDDVQHELEVASAELGLTHGALERHLPQVGRHGDVAWAIKQNAVLERKVQQAAEDLEQVTELLEQAKAEVAQVAARG